MLFCKQSLQLLYLLVIHLHHFQEVAVHYPATRTNKLFRNISKLVPINLVPAFRRCAYVTTKRRYPPLFIENIQTTRNCQRFGEIMNSQFNHWNHFANFGFINVFSNCGQNALFISFVNHSHYFFLFKICNLIISPILAQLSHHFGYLF